MIIVRLKGGLGNQMFEYAFAKHLAHQLQTDFKLDLSLLLNRSRQETVFRDYDLDIFQVEPDFLVSPQKLKCFYRLKSARLSKWAASWMLRSWPEYREPHFHVVTELLEQPADETVYNGWWQSPKYFEAISTELRKEFQFRDPLRGAAAELGQTIAATNAVCLNVRRTDFLQTAMLNTTDIAYFERGIAHICQQVESPHFYIFSDDVAWCAANIKVADYPLTVVSHAYKGRKFSDYLQLMSLCQHYIIPNSTFAWWATWLNPHPEQIVVAPQNWFADSAVDTSDLVPAQWVRC